MSTGTARTELRKRKAAASLRCLKGAAFCLPAAPSSARRTANLLKQPHFRLVKTKTATLPFQPVPYDPPVSDPMIPVERKIHEPQSAGSSSGCRAALSAPSRWVCQGPFRGGGPACNSRWTASPSHLRVDNPQPSGASAPACAKASPWCPRP